METVTTRELTCIGCPMGCPLTVTMEAGEVISVTGNNQSDQNCDFDGKSNRRRCRYGIGEDKRRYSERENL